MDRHVGAGSGFGAHLLWLYWFLWVGGGCAILGALAELGFVDTNWNTFATLGIAGLAMIGAAWAWHKLADPLG